MYNIKNMKIIEDAFIDMTLRASKKPIFSTIIVCFSYILFDASNLYLTFYDI